MLKSFIGENKMTKIAINGFGRIGRLAFRQMFDAVGYEVVAINDLTDAKTLTHLLKYDSAQGRFGKEVTYTDDSITVEGKKMKVYAKRDPKDLPWGDLDIDVVLECTGFFASLDASMAHIEAGAKKVVISAPAKGDLKTVVFAVNENILDGSEKVISAASCTTNCLAPMVGTLNKLASVDKAFMTTIHAYTNDQNTLDAPHSKDLRRARAAATNIVPASTGAAAAIGLVIPELKGKLDGNAQRVPVITGSLTELVAVVDGQVTVDEINIAMRAASNDSFGYNDEEIVSSDIIGITYGSLFDATLTKATPLGDKTLVKVTAWYDNEYSYVSQMVRTIKYFDELSK